MFFIEAASVIAGAIAQQEIEKQCGVYMAQVGFANKKQYCCKNCGAPEIGNECQYCKTLFNKQMR